MDRTTLPITMSLCPSGQIISLVWTHFTQERFHSALNSKPAGGVLRSAWTCQGSPRPGGRVLTPHSGPDLRSCCLRTLEKRRQKTERRKRAATQGQGWPWMGSVEKGSSSLYPRSAGNLSQTAFLLQSISSESSRMTALFVLLHR